MLFPSTLAAGKLRLKYMVHLSKCTKLYGTMCTLTLFLYLFYSLTLDYIFLLSFQLTISLQQLRILENYLRFQLGTSRREIAAIWLIRLRSLNYVLEYSCSRLCSKFFRLAQRVLAFALSFWEVTYAISDRSIFVQDGGCPQQILRWAWPHPIVVGQALPCQKDQPFDLGWWLWVSGPAGEFNHIGNQSINQTYALKLQNKIWTLRLG